MELPRNDVKFSNSVERVALVICLGWKGCKLGCTGCSSILKNNLSFFVYVKFINYYADIFLQY